MKPILLMFVAFLVLPTFSSAQSKYLKNKTECTKLSETVTDLFLGVKFTQADKEYKPYLSIKYTPAAGLIQSEASMMVSTFPELYENPVTSFKSSEETLGEIGLKQVFIVQFEKTIIKLTFVYLKTDKGWRLESFDDSTDYESEFK